MRYNPQGTYEEKMTTRRQTTILNIIEGLRGLREDITTETLDDLTRDGIGTIFYELNDLYRGIGIDLSQDHKDDLTTIQTGLRELREMTWKQQPDQIEIRDKTEQIERYTTDQIDKMNGDYIDIDLFEEE